MKYFAILAIALLTVSCTKQATPVDLANACAADNEKKYISTTGYLE